MPQERGGVAVVTTFDRLKKKSTEGGTTPERCSKSRARGKAEGLGSGESHYFIPIKKTNKKKMAAGPVSKRQTGPGCNWDPDL